MFRRIEKHPPGILITGGAGFIGANLAAHLLATSDARITVFDNLSHPGAALNLRWLQEQACAHRLRFCRGDVCSEAAVIDAVKGADEIFHLAARCEGAAESKTDFEVNATGTLNLLEAVRRSPRQPMVVYVSTAKVYAELNWLRVRPHGLSYQPVDPEFRGISERAPVAQSAPCDCSRGAAERFVLDYAHLYDVPAVSLRVDTVAGPRQIENHGHGWVSHLVYSILAGRPVTIYGNGLQVHDVMDVTDMVEALMAARAYIGAARGHVYNVGGGKGHAVSVNQMIGLIETVCHRSAVVRREPPRPGDRPFYYADSSEFAAATGWRVRRTLEQTVRSVAAFWYAQLAGTEMAQRPRPRRMAHSFRQAA
ncbi:MAG TPA: NAD-dependent epimerase/dehydratase family protein [Terracidiphilus sp.]|jgi:CDP-paratose 2-epimerase|nr:NAD-dependent epimerase/dehydratase family protein [Terracidiphilus sp.]